MAFKPKTFLDLCMAMKTGAIVQIDGPASRGIGTIIGIAKEDGSGYCWNVTIQPQGTSGTMADGLLDPTTVFFRE